MIDKKYYCIITSLQDDVYSEQDAEEDYVWIGNNAANLTLNQALVDALQDSLNNIRKQVFGDTYAPGFEFKMSKYKDALNQAIETEFRTKTLFRASHTRNEDLKTFRELIFEYVNEEYKPGEQFKLLTKILNCLKIDNMVFVCGTKKVPGSDDETDYICPAKLEPYMTLTISYLFNTGVDLIMSKKPVENLEAFKKLTDKSLAHRYCILDDYDMIVKIATQCLGCKEDDIVFVNEKYIEY